MSAHCFLLRRFSLSLSNINAVITFFCRDGCNLVTGRDGLKYQMELFLYISTYLLLLVSLLQTPNEPYHHLLLAVDPLSFWPTFWY